MGLQLLFNLAFRAVGWSGLVVVRAVIVAVAFGVTFAWTRRTSGNVIVAAGLTLAALVVTMLMPGTLALRPQLLAVPLLLIGDLDPPASGSPPGRSRVAACRHGGMGEPPRELRLDARPLWDRAHRGHPRAQTVALDGATTLACLLAAAINPWGFEIYGYVGDLATNPIVRDVIDEWRPRGACPPRGRRSSWRSSPL